MLYIVGKMGNVDMDMIEHETNKNIFAQHEQDWTNPERLNGASSRQRLVMWVVNCCYNSFLAYYDTEAQCGA
jgi:hypothetical protein